MQRAAITALIGVVLLFVALNRLIGLHDGSIEQVVSYLAYPVLKVQHAISEPIRTWRAHNNVLNNVLPLYEKVLKERDQAFAELAVLKGAQTFHEHDTRMQPFYARYKAEQVSVPVLARHQGTEQYLVIDAGTTSGLEKGMVVVIHKTLLGRISETYPYYAKVLLMTSPGHNVAVYAPKTGTQGVYHMHKTGRATLEYVDHLAPVHEGDQVLSSGKGGLYPRGFLVGTIAHIAGEGHNRSIVIEPASTSEDLDYVSVIPGLLYKETDKAP